MPDDGFTVTFDGTVATDSIRADGEAYQASIIELGALRDTLGRALESFHQAAPDTTDPQALGAVDSITRAIRDIEVIADQMTQIVEGMEMSALQYETTETLVEGFWTVVWASYFATLGFMFAPVVAVGSGVMLLTPDPQDDDDPTESVSMDGTEPPSKKQELINTLVSSGLSVDQIAAIVDGLDYFMPGAALGPGAAILVGDAGLGLVGTGSGALALFGVANQFGYLKEGPVATSRVSQSTIPAPQGVQQRTDLIPNLETDGGQIRVIRYERPGQEPTFEVYVGGTESFDFTTRQEPADMASNIGAMVGPGSGMERAVLQAMADAGITAESDVSFIGYSQGALMATRLAVSGAFNTQSLLTIGGPTGGIDIPPSVNALLIAHEEDTVTALGGTRHPSSAIEISREVFSPQNSMPSTKKVPAHHYEYYRETAGRVDNAESSVVVAATEELDTISNGATTVTEYMYKAKRTDAGPPSSGGGSW